MIYALLHVGRALLFSVSEDEYLLLLLFYQFPQFKLCVCFGPDYAGELLLLCFLRKNLLTLGFDFILKLFDNFSVARCPLLLVD